MNVSWCLRKLSKEIDRVIEIKWSYRDVDKVTDQMSIVSRVALFCAEVSIYVLIERDSNGITLCHSKLEEQIKDILSLGDHDAIKSLNYFYT